MQASHSGEVGNTTLDYNVNVVYTMAAENDSGTTKRLSIPLTLSVRMMDFNEIVYLLIVFIGVLVSRYTSKIYRGEDSKGFDVKTDGMWVFASGIITLLIFSSFQE